MPFDADAKVLELIEDLDKDLLESADELVDELWYRVQKGHQAAQVTQQQFDKITKRYHSMREALEVVE